jgi:hypothetical protein
MLLLVLEFKFRFRDFISDFRDSVTQTHCLSANPLLPRTAVGYSAPSFDSFVFAQRYSE